MNKAYEEVQARFNKVAAEWDNNPTRVALARAVVEAIRAAVPLRTEMQAMDFGAGTGLVTLGLLSSVNSVTAVDASGEMLRVLDDKLRALKIEKVHTLQCDISRAPLPANQFDLVVSSMVLHHLPEVSPVLQRLRPCLRPGGWIALTDLDTEDGSFHPDMTGSFIKVSTGAWFANGWNKPDFLTSRHVTRIQSHASHSMASRVNMACFW